MNTLIDELLLLKFYNPGQQNQEISTFILRTNSNYKIEERTLKYFPFLIRHMSIFCRFVFLNDLIPDYFKQYHNHNIKRMDDCLSHFLNINTWQTRVLKNSENQELVTYR